MTELFVLLSVLDRNNKKVFWYLRMDHSQDSKNSGKTLKSFLKVTFLTSIILSYNTAICTIRGHVSTDSFYIHPPHTCIHLFL